MIGRALGGRRPFLGTLVRGSVAATLAGTGLARMASTALAHAHLASAEPAADSIVTTAPTQLKLHFSEELVVSTSNAQAFDASGKRVDTGSQVDLTDRTLMVVTTPSLLAGVITVKWHSVSADDGDALDGSYSFTIATPAAQAPSFPDGSFLKGSGSRVYLIIAGKRHHVPSLAAFVALGGTWNAVQTVSDAALVAIPEQEDLVQGTGPDLFIQVGTVKVWVPTIAALNGLGYQGTTYRVLSAGALAAVPTHNDLVKGSGPDVFVLFSGLRYKIDSLATFIARGFLWADVQILTDAQLAAIVLVDMAAM